MDKDVGIGPGIQQDTLAVNGNKKQEYDGPYL